MASIVSIRSITHRAVLRRALVKGATVAVATALALGMARPTAAGFQVIGVNEVPRIVARALPAVVSITARRIERDQFNKSVPKAGLGSGVILDRHGHILTNNHVVEGFEEFKVTLPDGRTFRGTLVGGDFFTAVPEGHALYDEAAQDPIAIRGGLNHEIQPAIHDGGANFLRYHFACGHAEAPRRGDALRDDPHRTVLPGVFGAVHHRKGQFILAVRKIDPEGGIRRVAARGRHDRSLRRKARPPGRLRSGLAFPVCAAIRRSIQPGWSYQPVLP